MTVRTEDEWSNGDALTPDDLNDTFESSPQTGAIIKWHKSFSNTPSLPVGWAECNGQVLNNPDSPYDGQALPDLNGENRFLRGNSSSGGTGGQSSHFHYYSSGSREDSEAGDTSDYEFQTESHIPPYMDIVFIMKVV